MQKMHENEGSNQNYVQEIFIHYVAYKETLNFVKDC